MASNSEIRRPKQNDRDKLHLFFKKVIIDTFQKEGIGDKLSDIKDEIAAKQKYLEQDFNSNGETRYFLIASLNNEIIGSIEYGPASELINSCTHNALKGMPEVGTVFVHPEYQGRGIGNLLLHNIFRVLQMKGIEEFCLDSGYKQAQKIWTKKFGNPDYILKDYWDPGFHHMIWKVQVADCL